MQEVLADTQLIEVEALGERLSALRLCDCAALTAMGRSLEEHGQLSALVLFSPTSQLEIIDGFKRVRAARALGWTTLSARVVSVGSVDAKLRLRELHEGRGLTELEEAWLVRSLYREDHLNQPAIARLLSRHKSWVWRRLMLVESLETCVQSDVRLGLIAPRAAVALSRLPRGNQQARCFISGLSGAWSSTRAGGTLQPYAQIYVGPTGDLRMRVSPSDIGMPVDRVGANASCIQVK